MTENQNPQELPLPENSSSAVQSTEKTESAVQEGVQGEQAAVETTQPANMEQDKSQPPQEEKPSPVVEPEKVREGGGVGEEGEPAGEKGFNAGDVRQINQALRQPHNVPLQAMSFAARRLLQIAADSKTKPRTVISAIRAFASLQHINIEQVKALHELGLLNIVSDVPIIRTPLAIPKALPPREGDKPCES